MFSFAADKQAITNRSQMSTDVTSVPDGSKDSPYVLVVTPTLTEMQGCNRLVPDLLCKWQSEEYPASVKADKDELKHVLYSECMIPNPADLATLTTAWRSRVKETVNSMLRMGVQPRHTVVLRYEEKDAWDTKGPVTNGRRVKFFSGDDEYRSVWPVPLANYDDDDPVQRNTWNGICSLIHKARKWFTVDRREIISQETWDDLVMTAMSYIMRIDCPGYGPEKVTLDEYKTAGGEWPPRNAHDVRYLGHTSTEQTL